MPLFAAWGLHMRYFDLHCDTISECSLKHCGLARNNLHISVDGASAFETWAQFFAVWMPDNIRGPQAWERFLGVANVFHRETAANGIAVCGNSHELQTSMESKHKRAAIMSIEGSAALGGILENLNEAYDLGVRLITLTWNGACEAGGGCLDGRGLTPFGFELIARMRKLGIIIDVSHLSDRGFDDVASSSDVPFVASHSNSREMCNNPRNLTDVQFREIAARGGIVGLNLYPKFLGSDSIDSILRHVDHFLKLGGEKVLAIGADFDGASMPMEINGIRDMPKLYKLLLQNYGETTVRNIFFDNAYEFFKSALTGCKSCNNILNGTREQNI
jgi:membrane dipeptidase